MSTTGDIIRRKRLERKLSQAALGKLIDEDQKRISRLESGEAEPTLSEGLMLAELFEISPTELGGLTRRGLDLSGDWWAGWQTWKDDVERVDIHPLAIQQDGAFLQLDGSTRARTLTEGSYSWIGEMRLWDNEILMGWYVATDAAVRSKGSLYFSLHPHGQAMIGSWTGLSYAGIIVRGWGVIARERDDIEQLMTQMIETEGHLTAWPKPKKS